MSRKNVETVRRLIEAFQAAFERDDDVATFEMLADDVATSEMVADDLEWIPVAEIPGPRSYRGRDGFLEFMRAWTEDFERWSFDLERLVEAGDDRVVALVHQSGIGKGSGAPVELHFAMVFELEAGRVTRVRNYLDPAEALAASELSD